VRPSRLSLSASAARVLAVAAALSLGGCPPASSPESPANLTSSSPEAPPPRPIRFALLGDLFAGAKPSPAAQAVVTALSAERLDFTVLLGDGVPSGRPGEARDLLTELFLDVPGALLGAPGEQEYGDRSVRALAAFERLFRLGREGLSPPFPERSLSSEELSRIAPDPLGRWYAVRRGPALVVVLDAEAGEDEGFGDELEYLREVMRLAELPRTGVDIRHVFIALHRPPLGGKDEARLKDGLFKLFAGSTKLRAVFSAHARTYERYTLSRTRDGAPLSDVLYAVLGTGGALTAEGRGRGAPSELIFGETGEEGGRVRLAGGSSYADPKNGQPGAKRPIYGYGLVEISPEGDLVYRFVPVAAEGAPAWAEDSCRYGGGLIRWSCE
jgi:hypothetical protein